MSATARGLGFGLLALSLGCTGLFQEGVPSRVATYHRETAGSQLFVGAAEADITPEESVYLAGFQPNRTSTDLHAPLKARAIVLALGDMRIAIVGVDNLGLQRDDVEWIKTGIEGYANGCVFLCSSHTHAAPDLIGIWGWYLMTSGRTHDYLTMVRDGVVKAIAEATERARPAVLVRGEARVPPEGLVRNSNREGLFDPRLTVIQARDAASGEPIGALLNMGCHPEVFHSGNTMISPDFVGPLCDEWRDAGLGQAVFVNAALGAMVTPQLDGLEGMRVMVDGLLSTARRALDAAEPVEVDAMEVRRRDVYMALTSTGLLMGRLTMVIPRRAYGGYMRTSVGSLRIGPIEVLCVPGEMEPALAARIRATVGRPDLLLFGLCDDEVGYLLRAVDARDPEFAYERTMAPNVDAGEVVFEAVTGESGYRSP